MKSIHGRLSRLATALSVALLALFVVACGNSSDTVSVGTNNGGFGNGNQNNFVGSYLGANDLNGGQTSDLSLNVDAGGSATGQLTVNQPTAQTITPGTYAVGGTVSLTTGTFQLVGEIPGLGSFSIAGTLPTGNNLSTYTITIDGQTYQGNIQNADLGTPNTPNNTPGESNLISGGTLSNFNFNPDGTYNGVNPPITGQAIISGAVGEGQGGVEAATLVLTETVLQGDIPVIRTFIVSIVVPDGQDLQVGQAYSVADSPDGPGAVIALTEAVGTQANSGWSIIPGTTGQATITALDSNSITVDFDFNTVGPNSEIQNNQAEGIFNTSGLIVGNFAATP